MALLVLVISWVAWSHPASQQQQSRLNAVESDIYRIETRLNRIEAQLNQRSRSESPGRLLTYPIPVSGRNRPQLNREQMFDRLATLVIEQVNKLEARVSKLESRGAPVQPRSWNCYTKLLFNQVPRQLT